MSAFPRIQSPCPLSAGEQRAIDGHCGHCDKHVHRLDGMSEAERRDVLAAAGPVCVSYRLPAPRRVGRIGAVIAATLITTTAYASDPAPPQNASMQNATTSSTVAEALQAVKTEEPEWDDVLVMGGISAPETEAAQDDDTAPALPMGDADDDVEDLPMQVDETPDRSTRPRDMR